MYYQRQINPQAQMAGRRSASGHSVKSQSQTKMA